jgi:putative transposase
MNHALKTAHSFHLCRYHIVFIPKYRKAILETYRFLVSRLISEKLKELSAEIIELSVQPDHVHLFIEARPDANLSQMVGQLKSHLTKTLLDDCPELLALFPKRNLWARGYFIATCGVDSEVIESYIRNQ